jgi:hypothetical protein
MVYEPNKHKDTSWLSIHNLKNMITTLNDMQCFMINQIMKNDQNMSQVSTQQNVSSEKFPDRKLVRVEITNYFANAKLKCHLTTYESRICMKLMACHNLYTYISIIHYKSLILILSTCKNATSSHVMSSFSIEKYF